MDYVNVDSSASVHFPGVRKLFSASVQPPAGAERRLRFCCSKKLAALCRLIDAEAVFALIDDKEGRCPLIETKKLNVKHPISCIKNQGSPSSEVGGVVWQHTTYCFIPVLNISLAPCCLSTMSCGHPYDVFVSLP